MTSKNAVRAALLACLAVGGLAACGGGADGVSSPGEGVFVPSPPPAPPSPPVGPPSPPPPTVTPAASCPTGFGDAGVLTVPGGSLRNCQLPASITTTFGVQVATGVIYSISGRVDVGVDMGPDPANPTPGGVRGVLNVSPGVTIFGTGGLDHLVVNRGSAINAAGTASEPIVFTSRQNIQGTTNENSIGQWGGLVILGRAPISVCTGVLVPPDVGCVAQIEGTNAFYGGLTRNDNSGQLRFVRVQHSGFEILPNNELNGITLGGVGSATIVQNVQVHNSSDDGIEIFGGTVNLTNIVLTGNDDDSLDVDTGWRGSVNTLLAIQRPGSTSSGSHGFEFSSAGVRAPAGGPFGLNTIPRITNATLVGRASNDTPVMLLNSGNGLKLWNSVAHKLGGTGASAACLDLDDADTDIAAPTFDAVFMSCAAPFALDGNQQQPTLDRFNNSVNEVANGTTTLATRTGGPTSPSTVAFISSTNENAVLRVAPVNHSAADSGLPAASAFFGATPAIPTKTGAVTSGDTWYQGWTCSPLIGEEAC